MNVEFTKSFDEGFGALPELLREKSRKAIDLFLRSFESRRYPKGLRIHRCGPFLSLSVTMKHRIFVSTIVGGVRFVFIGDHEAADRYLRRQ